ncbi:MAG: ATP synthase F0 subunit B [Lachnospiraceae bacterium]|jgi:ABC-type transporter Mla subunit MlaD|nr:ATP synthase F0 subunit B [Lachnospiraceae bacterium]
MSSRIEQLIDEIEEFIEQCPYAKFSNDVIRVNKEELQELLRELRMKTPDEIKRYQKIISQKEAILKDAREKAQQMVNEAAAQTSELMSEHEIVQQAYARANQIVALATNQAQEILDNATRDANAMKEAAVQYTDDILGNVENILDHSIDVAQAKYDNLIASLQNCHSIVVSNRAELSPPTEEVLPAQETQNDENTSEEGEKGGLDLI